MDLSHDNLSIYLLYFPLELFNCYIENLYYYKETKNDRNALFNFIYLPCFHLYIYNNK